VGELNNRDILGKNEKIFLTGHTGFKGTWLTLLLEEMGHEVVGYSLEATPNSLFSRIGREGCIRETIGDVRDINSLKKSIDASKPTIVIHMAAQPLVLESYRQPRETFEINVQGTVNLFDAAFASDSIKVIGAVTTDKVYKNLGTNHAYTETDSLEGGSDPYSASKVAAEAAVSSWKKISLISGGPSIVTLRSGNVIGGGDLSDDRLIPDLVRSNLNGIPVHVRNPKSSRPWMHVLDSLNGYLLALRQASNENRHEVFNFAPEDESLQVDTIIDIALEIWPNMFKFQIDKSDAANLEAQLLNLNSSKARESLGWVSKWSQKEAVESSISWWHQVNKDKKTALEACAVEIEKLFR
jgi:CDP-glucose 4,6-dehydratase